jgi:hypothetical protein
MRWPIQPYSIRCRFVAVKSEQQQAAGLVFRTRDLLVRQRTSTHARPLRRFADRLGIDRVVFLPLHKRFHISGRNQPNFMAKLDELTGPVMCSTTCLQRYDPRPVPDSCAAANPRLYVYKECSSVPRYGLSRSCRRWRSPLSLVGGIDLKFKESDAGQLAVSERHDEVGASAL